MHNENKDSEFLETKNNEDSHLAARPPSAEPAHNACAEPKQLWGKSCAAFSCATLFAQVLHESDPSVDIYRTVPLLELSIYPQIWTAPHEISDQFKSMQYLVQFLSAEPKVITQPEAIASLQQLDPQKVYFFIRLRRGIPHALFVQGEKLAHAVATGDETYPTSEGPKKIKDIKNIMYILEMEKSTLKIDAISDLYKKSIENIENIFGHLHSLKTEQHYSGWLNAISQMAPLFPEHRETLKKIILHDLPLLNAVKAAEHISDPELKAKMKEQIAEMLKEPEKYFHSIDDCRVVAIFLPEYRESCIQIMHTMLGTYSQIDYFRKAVCCFPEEEEVLIQKITSQDANILGGVSDFESAVAAFPLHREPLFNMLITSAKRYLGYGLVDVAEALKIFPEKKEALAQAILHDPNTFLISPYHVHWATQIFPEHATEIQEKAAENNASPRMEPEGLQKIPPAPPIAPPPAVSFPWALHVNDNAQSAAAIGVVPC